MSHTPENWAKEPCEGSRHGGFYLVDSDGSGIGHIYAKFGAGEYNARRIVACVNACAGKETEDLEYMAGKDIFTGNIFSKRVATERERDLYRELCVGLLNSMNALIAEIPTVCMCGRGESCSACSRSSEQRACERAAKLAITKAESILGGGKP